MKIDLRSSDTVLEAQMLYESAISLAIEALDGEWHTMAVRALQAHLEVLLSETRSPYAREYETKQWQFWQEGDRFYHAKDKTWWRFDPGLNRLVRSEAP